MSSVQQSSAALSAGPLSGLRLLDMTSVIMGAYATQMLGDLGAEVFKIEQPGPQGGDVMRWPGVCPSGAGAGMGPLFMAYNRNKKSVALDLRSQEGRQACLDLALTCPVVVTNIREESLRKLGLDYASLVSVHPHVVYVHAVGFGSAGAYGGLAAYDDLIQAASGMTDLLPRVDHDPRPRYIPSLVADKTVALFLVQAVLAALFHWQRTGEGQYVEVPMMECMTHFTMSENLFGHLFDPPTGGYGYNRVLNPNRRPYKTKDGWIALMPYARHQWVDFMALAGEGDLMKDERFKDQSSLIANIEVLYGRLDAIAPTRTTQEWLDICEAKAIPAMRVNRLDTLMDDPHLCSVGFFERVNHPTEGVMVDLKHPVSYAKTPASTRLLPPQLGEHTQEVLQALSSPKPSS